MKAVLAVLAAVAVHLAVLASLPPEAVDGYRIASRMAFKLAAAGGCLWAAALLAPGDYMRRFWGLVAASYLLLTLAESWVMARAAADPARIEALSAALLVAGNAVSVVASARLALAYRAAGLGLATGPRSAVAWLGFAGLSLGIAGFGLSRELSRAVAQPSPEAWASALSYLADAAVFVLLVPVLRFARQLAGGTLARPWWTCAAATLAWLVFDATEPISALAGAAPLLVTEAARTLGTLLTALAGAFQAALVVSARAEASRARAA